MMKMSKLQDELAAKRSELEAFHEQRKLKDEASTEQLERHNSLVSELNQTIAALKEKNLLLQQELDKIKSDFIEDLRCMGHPVLTDLD